jgi:mannose-6-phosphate isomerase-like protein (cupin superfamily)
MRGRKLRERALSYPTPDSDLYIGVEVDKSLPACQAQFCATSASRQFGLLRRLRGRRLHHRRVPRQEEFYIPLEGTGTLHAEGQSYPMHSGVLIRVGAATKRKIVPGPEGLTLLMLSDRPDSK